MSAAFRFSPNRLIQCALPGVVQAASFSVPLKIRVGTWIIDCHSCSGSRIRVCPPFASRITCLKLGSKRMPFRKGFPPWIRTTRSTDALGVKHMQDVISLCFVYDGFSCPSARGRSVADRFEILAVMDLFCLSFSDVNHGPKIWFFLSCGPEFRFPFCVIWNCEVRG